MTDSTNASATIDPQRTPMARLLAPRSIAVLGASSDAEKFSGRPLAYLARLGYRGAVYPIHPEAETIQGFRCYRDIAAVPGPVDAVIVARPAAAVPDEVARCLALGIRAFVVFSGGFAEAGEEGAALQQRLVDLCRAAGAVVCGPNGTGLVNLPERATLSFMSNLDREVVDGGSVACISGSGSISAMLTQGRGRVLRLVASIGNEAVTTGPDFMAQVLTDPEVSGVVGFLEAIRDPAGLVRAARVAAATRKPIAILKAGRTARSAEVAATHTGALIDDDQAIDALFEHHNLIRAGSLEELKTLAVLMHAAARRHIGPRIGVVTPSGGTAVLIVDEILARGMLLPGLEDSTCATLQAIIPQSSPGNPMDITGFGASSATVFTQATLTVATDPNIDVVLIPTGGGVGKVGEQRARAMIDVAENTDKLIVPIWQGTTRDQPGYDALLAAGLPVQTDYQVVCAALGQLVRQRLRASAPAVGPAGPALAPPVSARLAEIRKGQAAALNETEAKELFAAAGITVPARLLIAPEATTPTLPTDFTFPAVLKVVSRDLAHKSAVGGVAVVDTRAGLNAALAAMRERIAAAAPAARIEAWLLEQMIGPGLELLVGIKRDARFGTLITLGLGGIWANSFKGAVTALLPLTPGSARGLLERFFAQFDDAGAQAVLVDFLLRLSELALGLGERLEVLEVNPVRLVGQGATARAVALDGVLTLAPLTPPTLQE